MGQQRGATPVAPSELVARDADTAAQGGHLAQVWSESCRAVRAAVAAGGIRAAVGEALVHRGAVGAAVAAGRVGAAVGEALVHRGAVVGRWAVGAAIVTGRVATAVGEAFVHRGAVGAAVAAGR